MLLSNISITYFFSKVKTVAPNKQGIKIIPFIIYLLPGAFRIFALSNTNKKRVYLLNDIYEPYKDELVGWGVTPLKGDLSKIKY